MVRQKFIEKARSQLGVAEPAGDDKYIKWYNKTMKSNFPLDSPWCAIFVSWCAAQIGMAEYLPAYASCTYMQNWFKSKGQFKSRRENQAPTPGDVVFYDWDAEKNNGPDHVGIVESFKNGYITVIEGNRLDKVCRREISVTDVRICGYGIPAFPTGDADGDGKITAVDAAEVLKKSVGKESKAAKGNSDVDGDGKVTPADAQKILKKAVGK